MHKTWAHTNTQQSLSASELSAQSTGQHTILAYRSQASQIMRRTGMRKGRAEAQCRKAVCGACRHAHARRPRCMRLAAAHCIKVCGTCHTMPQGGWVIRKASVLGEASRQCGGTPNAQDPITRCHPAVEAGKTRRLEQAAHLLACATQHGASCGVQLLRAQLGRRGGRRRRKTRGRSTRRGRASPLCRRRPVQWPGGGALTWRQRTREAKADTDARPHSDADCYFYR